MIKTNKFALRLLSPELKQVALVPWLGSLVPLFPNDPLGSRGNCYFFLLFFRNTSPEPKLLVH